MHGVLPPPVKAMLERKHGMFDDEPRDVCVDGGAPDAYDGVWSAVQQKKEEA